MEVYCLQVNMIEKENEIFNHNNELIYIIYYEDCYYSLEFLILIF